MIVNLALLLAAFISLTHFPPAWAGLLAVLAPVMTSLPFFYMPRRSFVRGRYPSGWRGM